MVFEIWTVDISLWGAVFDGMNLLGRSTVRKDFRDLLQTICQGTMKHLWTIYCEKMLAKFSLDNMGKSYGYVFQVSMRRQIA